MTYQLTYFSPSGYAEKLARALHELLPADTRMEPLTQGADTGADVHLLGFDLKMLDMHTLPLNITNHLKQLAGKTIFLFATVPFQPNDVLSSHVHNSAAAALPGECDYRGLYLCPSQAPDMLINGFRQVVERNPANTRARHWLERCEQAQGHPSEKNIQECCRFAKHVLKLNP